MAMLGGNVRESLLQHLNLPTIIVGLFGGIGGMGFGIDYGYWSGLLGMEQFSRDFGKLDSETGKYYLLATYKSVGSGPPIAGLAVGALISGFFGRRLGRINTIRMASIVSVIAVIIQVTCGKNYWQLVAGRIINSVALGLFANTIPAYLAEVAPRAIRATIVNFYQVSIGIGALLCFTSNWGTHARTDQWAYKTVILLQLIIPFVFIPASFFIPESPRWLLSRGNRERAMKSLHFLRRDVTPEVISQEADLIVAAEEENKEKFSASWLDTIRGSNLRRTLIVIGMQCLHQAQGSSFMSSYSIIFMQAVGIQDVYKIAILLKLTTLTANACCFYLPDRVGRKPILVCSSIVEAISMATVAAIKISPLSNDSVALKGALACLFFWYFCDNLGWASCTWIVTSEVPSLQVREKTITIATVCGYCVSILVNFVSPYIQDAGYGNLGVRIGFLYAGFSVFAVLWSTFYLPETGFRTLEELDELFQERVGVWKFRKYKTRGFGAQLGELEQHNVIQGVKAGEYDDVEEQETSLERKG